MNFQAHLENAYEIMKEEFVVLFIGGLLIQIMTTVSLGLLAGPLMGGYLLLLVFWLREGRKPVFNDLFSGMQRFGQLFPVFLLGVLIFFGFMLFVIPGVLFMTWWVYVICFMADKEMTLGNAMRASKDIVSERGFFMHLVFLFMIYVVPVFLISVASALVPPLAALQYFLFPLQCACQASLYLEQVDGLDPANCFKSQEVRPRIPLTPAAAPEPSSENQTMDAPPPPPPPPPEDENET